MAVRWNGLESTKWKVVDQRRAGSFALSATLHVGLNPYMASSAAGCVLRQNSDLGTTNWTPVASGITVAGTNNTLTIKASSGNGFYQLTAP